VAQVNGDFYLQGGLGTAQNKSQLNLTFDHPYVTLKALVGVAGVDKETMNMQTDRSYTLLHNGELYQSSREVEYEGKSIFYGGGFKSNFSESHLFEGNISVANHRFEGTGSMSEWRSTYAVPSNRRLYDLDMQKHDGNCLNADLSYLFRTQRKGEHLNVQYKVVSVSADIREAEENYYELNPVYRTSLQYTQDMKEVKHTAAIDWNRPLSDSQFLNVGFEYENRRIESEDHHESYSGMLTDSYINPSGFGYTSSIDYKTQTEIYHVAYQLKLGSVVANLRADFHHAELPSVKLDDVVPTARLQWKPNASQTVIAQYGQRIIRPDFERLNPFKRILSEGEYAVGNMELRGIHVNNAALIYKYNKGSIDFGATLTHIFSNDGFNGLWYETSAGERYYAWGNEGKRRAWSVSPELKWQVLPLTTLSAKGQVIWDKRIADAISMAKEHWGATASLAVDQQLPSLPLSGNLHAAYSEGNTLDLYSHEGRSVNLGGSITCKPWKVFSLNLAYDYKEYARTVITQGVALPGPGFYGWTGSEYRRPQSRHSLLASLRYSF